MADSKISALTTATTLDGTEQLAVVQGGASKKTTVADIRVIDTVKRVGTDQANSTTTAAAITDFTTSLAAGTYLVKGWLVWQSAATTTGAGFYLNASGGTVTRNTGHVYTTTTGTTATSGIADQSTVAATFQMIESRAWRANNTNPGAFGGVDTASADQFAVLEALVVVTVATSLQVMIVSEVASSAVTIMAGSTLTITKSA